ncbi:MAG: hypothetical protein IJY53_00445, partial [Akkermansia sp.]|nr:hypothetical protein [Akkermansia sp.]
PVQSDAEVRQPFISRAGIIFIPTTYYHNSWWLAHLSPSFRDFFDAVPLKFIARILCCVKIILLL